MRILESQLREIIRKELRESSSAQRLNEVAFPFTSSDREEGNKFRAWVNDNKTEEEIAALYPNWRDKKLGPSGRPDNAYVKKAWAAFGEEYSNQGGSVGRSIADFLASASGSGSGSGSSSGARERPSERVSGRSEVEKIAAGEIVPSSRRKNLRRGDRGPGVRYIQTMLSIGVDGDFGGGTEKAVRAFQKSVGLPFNGAVGQTTAVKLIALPAPIQVETETGQVADVQLSDMGSAIMVAWPGYAPKPSDSVIAYLQGLKDRGLFPGNPRKPWGAGHAGIALCNSKSGRVTYFDFGRYPPATGGRGAARMGTVSITAQFDIELDPGYPVLINGTEISEAIKSMSLTRAYSGYTMEASVVNKVNVAAAYRYAARDVGKVTAYSLGGTRGGSNVLGLCTGCDDPVEELSRPRNCGTWAINVLQAGGVGGGLAGFLRQVGWAPASLLKALPNDRGQYGEKISV